MLVETKSRFSQEKRAYYELAPIAKVFHKNDTNRNNQYVKDKWNHVIPLPTYFHGELIRWILLWMRQKSDSRSMTTILKQHADTTFFPNMWEFFKTLCVIPVGSVEAEESFFLWKMDQQLPS